MSIKAGTNIDKWAWKLRKMKAISRERGGIPDREYQVREWNSLNIEHVAKSASPDASTITEDIKMI